MVTILTLFANTLEQTNINLNYFSNDKEERSKKF